MCITVLTEYRRVTDRQTDILSRRSPLRSPRYAYASRGKNCLRSLSFGVLVCAVKFVNSFAKRQHLFDIAATD